MKTILLVLLLVFVSFGVVVWIFFFLVRYWSNKFLEKKGKEKRKCLKENKR